MTAAARPNKCSLLLLKHWSREQCPSACAYGQITMFPLSVRFSQLPLWSSRQEFLATDPEARVRIPSLPDCLRSSGSGTGSTRLHEYN
jgi:hypothetical protein